MPKKKPVAVKQAKTEAPKTRRERLRLLCVKAGGYLIIHKGPPFTPDKPFKKFLFATGQFVDTDDEKHKNYRRELIEALKRSGKIGGDYLHVSEDNKVSLPDGTAIKRRKALRALIRSGLNTHPDLARFNYKDYSWEDDE